MGNKINISEHDYQVQVIDWANAHHVKHPALKWLYAVPNGARTAQSVANRLKAEGMKAGVPDLFLPHPAYNDIEYSPPDVKYHGLYIEMKSRDTKGRLSQEQKNWIAYLTSAGYRVEVAWTAKEAIEILEDYLNGN